MLRLTRLQSRGDQGTLLGSRSGLEKESLRVRPDGHMSLQPHPAALGSALTHPYITTDFSEALLEFVTPPHTDVRDTLRFLEQLHAFTYRMLGEELLWATSMPCMVSGDEDVPLADYGSSNVGIMKRVYRRGLGKRYGRVMQTISGVHFNFSFSEPFWAALQAIDGDDRALADYTNDGYFALIRNFQRFGWIVPYLFGASPALCKSFLKGRKHDLPAFDDGTLHLPWATSLRMSDLGYKNSAQASLEIDYGDINSYVRSLTRAIETPYPPFERIGVKVDGEYLQLNDNLLQIENEYYSFVRPKQIARSGEKPTLALSRRGVLYVEIRALDVNPFAPAGVDESQLRVLETLMLLCALRDSPPVSSAEYRQIEQVQREVATRGREPGLRITLLDHEDSVIGHAARMLQSMLPMAAALDDAHGGRLYSEALEAQLELSTHPDRLPSARILQTLTSQEIPFFRFAMNQSIAHRDYFLSQTPDSESTRMLQREASHSLQMQAEIEASDVIDFDEYLRRYLSQTLEERAAILG
ncbi:MAG: glutamate--cysteine ligase [Gammaproteobacteria bacterium]|nr:glutamate--cysteine ligase [Gammaproteobacteria bacterium]